MIAVDQGLVLAWVWFLSILTLVIGVLALRRKVARLSERLADLEVLAMEEERPSASRPKWLGGVKPTYVSGKPGGRR